MEEHTERNEPLREELLEWVTGASGNASTSNNPGSVLACVACQAAAQRYGRSIYYRDHFQAGVDQAVAENNYALADRRNEWSTNNHLSAQEEYRQMAAHGHPDFPAALREQRRNYNPPN